MARVKRAVNAQKKRREVLEPRQRVPRSAVAPVPQGEGAGHPLPRLRLPRPPRPQGRLPPAVDPADQRRGPRERHHLQPLHPGPEAGGRRGRPPHPRRPRRERRRGLHGARRHGEGRRAERGRVGRRAALLRLAPGRLRPQLTGTERPAAAVLSNPGSDRVRAVRRLTGRSARRREGRFVAEGPQAVAEAVGAHADAVRAGARAVVRELYATPDAAQRYPDLVATARSVGSRGPARHARGARRDGRHRDPAGPARRLRARRRPAGARCSPAPPRLVAVLAFVRDPGNAGTVLRAADAAGAGGVVLTDASVDVHNPKCVRASAGSIFHLPVATGVPFGPAVDGLRDAGLTVLRRRRRRQRSTSTTCSTPRRPGARAVSPGRPRGCSATRRGACPTSALAGVDAVVRVPVHGRAESLNLATAATVCLYASARAHRPPRRRDQADDLIAPRPPVGSAPDHA